MKEKMKIIFEVKLDGIQIHNPHYLNAERTFHIETSRAMLFRSLDAMERKLKRLYPLGEPSSPTKRYEKDS